MESEEFSPPGFPHCHLVLTVEDVAWHEVLGGNGAQLVAEAVAAAARGAGLDASTETELGVTLSSDAAVRELNAEWRGKDKATNILSFPMVQLEPGDSPGPMLGDLILALETVKMEALMEQKAVKDHFRHLVVHGLLHLLGYDHEEAEAAEIMEALEISVLSTLAIANPYDDSDAVAGAEPAEKNV
ncbi:rRNA maturation RNase YbeY [Aureimonas fodinaquatilis]|uniref:Endoribonuclease YbeY n=1 Tax=Aureimonas fodinaquatilis TaxID=2565783 RepID=A0A5B0DS42_9HYPH|nr:rRNA maturation RNase YbeY [Aureimonas fodinaquatilis]KAA0968571.1 rRNA maturation RNase YbeY [Aureimonas fodinaquatilis]